MAFALVLVGTPRSLCVSHGECQHWRLTAPCGRSDGMSVLAAD